MIFKEQTSSLPSLIMGELWLYVLVEYTVPDTLQVCPSMDIDSVSGVSHVWLVRVATAH